MQEILQEATPPCPSLVYTTIQLNPCESFREPRVSSQLLSWTVSLRGTTTQDGSQFKVETLSSHSSESHLNSALASCLIQTKGEFTNVRLETGFPSVQLIGNSNQYWRLIPLSYPDGLRYIL